MAFKPSPNSLIHCAVCGEDYSATYKRCPFCGAKNAPSVPAGSRQMPSAPAPAPRQAPPPPPEGDPDDTYVFDGQDLFDEEPVEEYRPAHPKGGKRLAEKPSSNPFAEAQINWPRMITFLCSLIIIVAALIIVFTVIYPQLRGTGGTAANATEQPTLPASDSVDQPTQPVEPGTTDPLPGTTDPLPNVTDPLPVGEDEPTGLSITGRSDVTLRPGAGSNQYQIKVAVTPADWNGTVTYESSDPSLATVSATGLVTHAKPDVTGLHRVTINIRAGTLSTQCTVFITGPLTTTQPPSSEPPAQSDPPVEPTQAPPSGGNVVVGRSGTIVNAEGGLRVRSGPGTNNAVIGSLSNGQTVNVVSEAGDGWYQISYPGAGGAATTGYIRGEYISSN